MSSSVSRLAELAERERRDKLEEDTVGSEAAPIRAQIERIREIGTELESHRDAFLASNSKAKQAKIDAKNTELERTAEQALVYLNIMEQRTREDLQAKRINRTTADVRRSVAARLQKELHAESERQLKLRRDHEQDVENQVARRVRVRYTDANGQHKSPEECQKLARVMVKNKQQDFLFLQARAELEDALSQYSELIELQEDVSSLCQLVNHLNRLTQRQEVEVGAMEVEMNGATRALKNGARDVAKARKV